MSSAANLILASSSAYRRELLQRLGLPFRCMAPDVDESGIGGESPAQQVVRLAQAKTAAVAPAGEAAVVIGSDQLAVLDGGVLGKPGDAQTAAAQLRHMRSRTVEFLTAVCVLEAATGTVQTDVVPFNVAFRDYSDAEIHRYIEADRPLDCAGSFKSERLGITLVRRMEGTDPTALIGLPLIRLSEMLRAAGVLLP